ncbi:GNAT family N-acetyltransferase [Brevibacillus massiliensis]|jgi:ribosomal protein S18 acetylase RimI-like enzyme|uniref:GNAT family N-acetyltransferase n=1 Tax=Brevibacillus massiliensis TaxID=1118054 RepID=UPI00030C3F80|nr:GNAT family N-acetyltransferase [Brevibacillus massiliensis]
MPYIISLLHCAIGSIANTLAGTPDEREAGEDGYYLDSLAVHQAYRGWGFGKGLVQAFEAQICAIICKKA